MSGNRPDAGPGATPPAPRPARTFTRVMIVQVVTLILLWLLQSAFGQG
jgi:hypothetical protein